MPRFRFKTPVFSRLCGFCQLFPLHRGGGLGGEIHQDPGNAGDFRTYGYTVALRAVRTTDFMTCTPADLGFELLCRVAGRSPNEVKGISRVVYDITGKPPATIEWE